MIRFEKVSRRFQDFQALHQLDFTIAQGEMVFVTGHSGAGKTSLLKLVSLLDKPTEGNIYFKDKAVNRLRMNQRAKLRRQFGIVLQNPHLLFKHTVFDNVALPLVIMGLSQDEIKKRVRAALAKVDLLAKQSLFPAVLSAGEQQRVAIARAIVNRPAFIVADEPTGNLDPDLSVEIMDLFRQFNQIGVGVLIATHDVPLIARYACRILRIEKGELLSMDYHQQTQENADA